MATGGDKLISIPFIDDGSAVSEDKSTTNLLWNIRPIGCSTPRKQKHSNGNISDAVTSDYHSQIPFMSTRSAPPSDKGNAGQDCSVTDAIERLSMQQDAITRYLSSCPKRGQHPSDNSGSPHRRYFDDGDIDDGEEDVFQRTSPVYSRSTPNLFLPSPGDSIILHCDEDAEYADNFKDTVQQLLKKEKVHHKIKTWDDVCLPGMDMSEILDFVKEHYFLIFVLITKTFIDNNRKRGSDETVNARIFALLSQRDKSHHMVPVLPAGGSQSLKDMPSIFKNLVPLKMDDKKFDFKIVATVKLVSSKCKKRNKKRKAGRFFSFFGKGDEKF